MKALAALERAMALTGDEQGRFYLYSDLCWAAYLAGDMDKARKYSAEYLAAAAARKDNWNYGNAIHHANTVLGLADISGGNAAAAAERLKAAGDTPGSPQLNSFGPSFELAAALLAKGERDPVLAYLDAVLKFWKKGELVEGWKYKISYGQVPNFSITR